MEVNRQEYNQRRTSMVRFLGELYNYRLVDSSLVFKVLYSLITFGVVQLDQEEPADSLDPPEHMLRHAERPAQWKFFKTKLLLYRDFICQDEKKREGQLEEDVWGVGIRAFEPDLIIRVLCFVKKCASSAEPV